MPSSAAAEERGARSAGWRRSLRHSIMQTSINGEHEVRPYGGCH